MTTPHDPSATSAGVDGPIGGGGPTDGGGSTGGDPPPRDERSLLPVLIGSAAGGIVAGLLAALVGSDPVAAVVFGFLIGVLWLWMDLRARGARHEEPPGRGGGGT